MPKTEKPSEDVDWSLATWDGSRREALRRWAKLPLERVIGALEEMRELSDMLAKSRAAGEAAAPAAESAAREPRGDYDAKTATPSVSTQDAASDGHHESRQPNKKRSHER